MDKACFCDQKACVIGKDEDIKEEWANGLGTQTAYKELRSRMNRHMALNKKALFLCDGDYPILTRIESSWDSDERKDVR